MKSLLTMALVSLTIMVSGQAHAGIFDPKFGSIKEAQPDAPPVQYSEIKAWKSIGHRWAAAMNDKGDVVGIYDLAYPELFSRFPFTVIGGRSVKKTEIIKMIWDAKVDPDIDKKLADKAIEDLQKAEAGPIDDGALPANWWQKVKWKNARVAAAGEPTQFRLSDLDILSSVKDVKKFKSAVSQFESALIAMEGENFGSGFFDRIEFQRTGSGKYELFFNGPARAVSKPKKIADLQSTKYEFFNAFKLELAKQVIDKAIDLITMPILNGIVDTAVDRFFHFHKLVMRTHQGMVLEMLNTMQDNPAASDALTETERLKAIEALSFAQSSLLTGWKWIWKKPVDEWNKDVKKQQDQAAQGMDWLKNHNIQVNALNPRFAFSLNPATNSKKLLIVAKDKPNSKNGPSSAIDYEHIDTPYRARVFMEVSTAAVVFGSRFIPLVGSYVKKAFKEFVEKPYDKSKIWEGRLTAHLEARADQDYSSDLLILDKQRVNPFFPSRAKMMDLIGKRKAMLGLP